MTRANSGIRSTTKEEGRMVFGGIERDTKNLEDRSIEVQTRSYQS